MVATIKLGPGLKKSLTEIARGKRETRKAIAQAIDDTTRQVRTRASREIRGDLAVSAGDLRPRLRRQIAYTKGRPRLVGRVYVSEMPLKLSRFKQRQTPDGVSVQIRKGGAPKVFQDTFGPKHGRLRGGVYSRAGRSRKPLRNRGGVPLARFAKVQGAIDRTDAAVPELLANNVRRRLNLLNLRSRGRA